MTSRPAALALGLTLLVLSVPAPAEAAAAKGHRRSRRPVAPPELVWYVESADGQVVDARSEDRPINPASVVEDRDLVVGAGEARPGSSLHDSLRGARRGPARRRDLEGRSRRSGLRRSRLSSRKRIPRRSSLESHGCAAGHGLDRRGRHVLDGMGKRVAGNESRSRQARHDDGRTAALGAGRAPVDQVDAASLV